MTIKRPKPEEIIVKRRQVEVLMERGMPRIDAFRQISVTEQTYYRDDKWNRALALSPDGKFHIRGNIFSDEEKSKIYHTPW